MSNLAKLEFVALDISGKNYLSWVLDAEIHLDAKGLGDTIKVGNTTNSQDKAKAMIFLRRHLHEDLKVEYLTVKDPQTLWGNLKERYDHQKTVILPKARYDWLHLRLQDFKSVNEYNSAMFRITSQLKLCGENITDAADMLENTYSTFHANDVLSQTQYREKGFIKYSELISCLLVTEQNNKLLLKNHESRPTGSTPFPEVNATSSNKYLEFLNFGRGRGRGRARGRGRSYGYGRGYGYGYAHGRINNFKKTHMKWECNDGGEDKKDDSNTVCYRCGDTGHWSRVCRTPKHLVELYQESLKQHGKMETNFMDGKGDGQTTHLETNDFFTTHGEKND